MCVLIFGQRVCGTHWPVCATSLASVFVWGCMFFQCVYVPILPRVCASYWPGFVTLFGQGLCTVVPLWPISAPVFGQCVKIRPCLVSVPQPRNHLSLDWGLCTAGVQPPGDPKDFGSFGKFSVSVYSVKIPKDDAKVGKIFDPKHQWLPGDCSAPHPQTKIPVASVGHITNSQLHRFYV